MADKAKPLFMSLKKFETKVLDFLQTAETDLVVGTKVAYNVSSAFLAWFTSDKTQSIVNVIVAQIPEGKTWSDDCIKLATAIGADAQALTNSSNWKGIALRLFAEIVNIIHGGKHPKGIDGYILLAQQIFTGE